MKPQQKVDFYVIARNEAISYSCTSVELDCFAIARNDDYYFLGVPSKIKKRKL